ncbi:MAG: phospholipase D-like domain-containing protein [Balneolales bacterium]|nr:phospholipase D-like domain-containing protein [Balneolales bacterium]
MFLLRSALFLALMAFTPLMAQAQFLETFENATKGSYADGPVNGDTGEWLFRDALVGTLETDKKNGSRAARVRNAIEMQFDKSTGAGEISFLAANFGNDSGGAVQVAISMDGGTTWSNIGGPISLTGEAREYSLDVNESGNVRVRFTKTAGNRINIDDIRITDAIAVSEGTVMEVSIGEDVVLDGSTVDFGVLTDPITVPVQIRSVGEDLLDVSDILVTGDGFSLSGFAPFSLQSLERTSVSLQFNGTTPGLYSGTLSIVSNNAATDTFRVHVAAELLDVTEVTPLSEARTLPQGTLVTVTGWVTVSDQFAGPVYFQDDTAAIAWYSDPIMRQSFTVGAEIGDSIVVTGRLGEFNGLIQIVQHTDFEVFPESAREIEPRKITLAQLNSGAYESELIRIDSLSFRADGLFSGGTNYTVDGVGGSGQVRVDNFANIAGSSIPLGQVNVTGVASRFNQTFQLIPRFRNDIREVIDGPVITSAPPFEYHSTPTSITFAWETEMPAHSEVRFGRTSGLELGNVSSEQRTTAHNVTISGLQPATTYRVQLRSAADADTSFTSVYISSTASPSTSTGQINVFFNKPVNHTIATTRLADHNVNFAQQLIDRIQGARQSVDLAFYSLSGNVGDQVADAVIDAFNNRELMVRVITSGHTGNQNDVFTKIQNAGVPITQSLGSEQHHNKFGVFDAEDPANSWVVTSSWNATDDGTFNQQQNMVHFQDQAMARAYTLEFDQMWGGESGGPFTAATARFSANKEVVNPSVFWVGPDSVMVELYFSPQANTEAQINRTLTTAQENIDLGLNLITRRSISNTIRARHNQGVTVRGSVGDVSGFSATEFEYLASWADVLAFPRTNGLLHHKYAIIDGENTTSNSKVITGSHNWSNNANTRNDENTVIIHSERVANEFLQEFAARYIESGGTGSFTTTDFSVSADLPGEVVLSQNYPNPFNPSTSIRFELPVSDQIRLEVYDVLGQRIAVLVDGAMQAGVHEVRFDGANLSSGVYVYRLQAGNTVLTRKMMLIK